MLTSDQGSLLPMSHFANVNNMIFTPSKLLITSERLQFQGASQKYMYNQANFLATFYGELMVGHLANELLFRSVFNSFADGL